MVFVCKCASSSFKLYCYQALNYIVINDYILLTLNRQPEKNARNMLLGHLIGLLQRLTLQLKIILKVRNHV